MTTTRADLFHAILASPDDDAPRLVYADYLEEHGELPRAMLIRHQCDLAQLQPWDRRHTEAQWAIASLLAEHGRAWRAELPALDGVTWTDFDRGFCASVRAADVAKLYAAADDIARAAPVFRVELGSIVEPAEPAFPDAGIPWLRVLKFVDFDRNTDHPPPKRSILDAASELELDLDEYDAGDWLDRRGGRPVTRIVMHGETVNGLAFARRFGTAPWARKVRTLLLGTEFVDMDTGYYEDPTMREAGAEALADAGLVHVTQLSVSNQRVGSLGLAAIVHSMPRLTELAAARCEIDKPGALADAPGEPFVAVDLGFNAFGDAGTEALLGVPRAAQVESLVLRACGVSATGLDAIARAPCWQTLRSLDLGASELGVDGAVVLGGVAPPAHLSRVRFDDCDLTPDAARLLATLPWLRELFALDLGKNPIDGNRELISALADSEIQSLGVRACGLTSATADALAPAWGRLRTLDLRRNATLGDAGFAALVTGEESPILELDVSHCGLTYASIPTFARMVAPRLRVLKLAGNAFGNATGSGMLLGLVRMPMFARVEVLDVSHCGFDEDVPSLLEKAGELPVLGELGLRGKRFEEDALRHLADLVGTTLPNLTRMRVDGQAYDLEDAERAAMTAKFGKRWWYEARPSAAYGYGRDADVDFD